jgi:small GTP-binding protein
MRWLKRLFSRKKAISLGLYGSTNVGKTTLANRICMDLMGEPLGAVSKIPHETRVVQKKEQVVLNVNGMNLSMNLLDMPGVAVKVDYRDFMDYGLSAEEAKRRSREATKGIIEAIRWLENVDAALVVIDACEDPYTQVNITIMGNLEARNIPVILVANKIDLTSANTQRVRDAFPQYPLVEISAITGENMPKLYEEIASRLY